MLPNKKETFQETVYSPVFSTSQCSLQHLMYRDKHLEKAFLIINE